MGRLPLRCVGFGQRAANSLPALQRLQLEAGADESRQQGANAKGPIPSSWRRATILEFNTPTELRWGKSGVQYVQGGLGRPRWPRYQTGCLNDGASILPEVSKS